VRVWEALRQGPPGSTASYAEIAERLGQPRAAQAVAQACAANPIAVAIPCQRVERKAVLLKRGRPEPWTATRPPGP
jgi:AraC family transcriptional regulator of adaptative response/methylated-DNA-[protein]-cysteine methyltransferase